VCKSMRVDQGDFSHLPEPPQAQSSSRLPAAEEQAFSARTSAYFAGRPKLGYDDEGSSEM